MMVETIHEEWGSIYLKSHTAKAHLFEGCEYVSESMEPEDIEKYPPGHLEFCQKCVEYFKRWRENTQGSESQCDRCGQKRIEETYCGSCQRRIQHKKAKRQL